MNESYETLRAAAINAGCKTGMALMKEIREAESDFYIYFPAPASRGVSEDTSVTLTYCGGKYSHFSQQEIKELLDSAPPPATIGFNSGGYHLPAVVIVSRDGQHVVDHQRTVALQQAYAEAVVAELEAA